MRMERVLNSRTELLEGSGEGGKARRRRSYDGAASSGGGTSASEYYETTDADDDTDTEASGADDTGVRQRRGGGAGAGGGGVGILRRISYHPAPPPSIDRVKSEDSADLSSGDDSSSDDDDHDDDHGDDYDEEIDAADDEGYLSDPFLHAVDYLEDEIDGHAYDDLVPLSVRLAVEEHMFGWSHLFSDIAGHVFYTAFWASVTWWMVTWIGLERIKEGEETVNASFFKNRTEPYYEPRLGFSFHTFVLIRAACTLSSAVSSFRTVRRRKKVWLRAPYGSAEYKADLARRRRTVEETDRLTVLGKIRRGAGTVGSAVSAARAARAARKVRKKLRRAEMRFERRHRHGHSPGMRLTNLFRRAGAGLGGVGGDAYDVANRHHHRVKLLSQGGGGSVGDGSSRGGKVRRRKLRPPVMEGGNERPGVIYDRAALAQPSHTDPAADDEGTAATASSFGDDDDQYYSKEDAFHTPRDSSWVATPGTPRISNAMGGPMSAGGVPQSILRDQLPLPSGPIHSVPYAHGGFFGAAPFMLADPLWVDVLRSLMPDVYVEISRRVQSAPVPKLIHWAENNPVVAAYGTAHEMERSGKLTAVEWDVFLDPRLVRRVEIVLEERDRFLARLRRNVPTTWDELHLADGDVYAHSSHVEALPPMATESDAAVLRYYNREIRKRTTLLVDRMLIAHGNLTQLVLEQTGFAKFYNFSRVKRTRRTLGGGIFARQWLAVYAEALKMGMGWEDGGGAGSGAATPTSSGHTSANESYYDSSSYPSSSVPTTPGASDTESDGEMEDVPLLSNERGGSVEMTSTRAGDDEANAASPKGQQSSGCGSYEPRKQAPPPPDPPAAAVPPQSPIPSRQASSRSVSSSSSTPRTSPRGSLSPARGGGGALSPQVGAPRRQRSPGPPRTQCRLMDEEHLVTAPNEMVLIDAAENVRSSTSTFKSSGNSRRRKRGGCYRTRDYHYCDGTCRQVEEDIVDDEEGQGLDDSASSFAAAADGGKGKEGWKPPPLPLEWQKPPQQTATTRSDDGSSKGTSSKGSPGKSSKGKRGGTPLKKPIRSRRVISARHHHARPLTSLSALALSSTPNTTMPQSIDLLRRITDCRAPLGLVLDVKSRHVSHRVWALVVDALRDAGARVEGIASFTWDEIRDISRYCASPVREIYFFHSAGDLQRACHEGHVREGDCVFFNAGSLIWDRVNWGDAGEVCEVLRRRFWERFDASEAKGRYVLMPYAEIRKSKKKKKGSEGGGGAGANAVSPSSSTDEDDEDDDSMGSGGTSSSRLPMLTHIDGTPMRSSTIQEYKERYNLSVGLYCQEFAVDESAVEFFVRHVNDHAELYDLGLSWGGVNGITVRGIQPGRFTNTDGFWNQRYAGYSWDGTLFPPERAEDIGGEVAGMLRLREREARGEEF